MQRQRKKKQDWTIKNYEKKEAHKEKGREGGNEKKEKKSEKELKASVLSESSS